MPLGANGNIMNVMIKLGLVSLVLLQLQACAPILVGGATAGASAVHDRRTLATSLEDQNIELKALSFVLQDKALFKHTSIGVTSYNLHVLLTGQAKDEALVKRYIGYVETIPRVARVINEIVIAPKVTATQSLSDGYISTQIKIRLFNIKQETFDPSRVKVVTENGVVYLMGILTRTEANQVVEIVRYVKGVRRVVKVFEYLD